MKIDKYFQLAIDKKASDLHLIAGTKPTLRIASELIAVEDTPLTKTDLAGLLTELLTKEQFADFEHERELDFAYSYDNWRFRVNLHFQRGQIGLAARLIPQQIPTPEDLGFSEVMYALTHLNHGLILVTGPSGCGKSTTLAAMIEIINRERSAHIITIEDPIEFLYTNTKSMIEQREVGEDTPSFASALKYVLRQDPNVILVGEMRDLETIQAALTAAETGHLVLSTLHTPTAADTVERIIDMFEGVRQRQVLIQLASTLRAVIAQQLLPTVRGGLVAAREIMLVNPAIANLIREHRVAQIASVIQTSVRDGMVTMEMAVKKLYQDGVISDVVAKHRGSEKGRYF
ncbi:MAG: Twitching motility protein [Parcubacteria group bacterium GW2011_GWA2_47_26]|nr:MAG: Twitching motility protein [Parcubacteria group bacterium GW2011_GWA2_47_26]